MKKPILLLASLLLAIGGHSQSPGLKHLFQMNPKGEFESLSKEPVYSDENVSSVVLWIKGEIKLHKHLTHTEHVIILKGKGVMQLGNEVFPIRKGDLVVIPQGSPHAVKVKGAMLKVISIQAPEFDGNDRVWLEEGALLD